MGVGVVGMSVEGLNDGLNVGDCVASDGENEGTYVGG